MTTNKVYFVDGEEHMRVASRQALDVAGFDVTCFASTEPIANLIDRNFDGVVVSDIRMPCMDGATLLGKLLEIDLALPVILTTDQGNVPLAVEVMRNGAYDLLEKPFAFAHLTDVVGRALEKRHMTLENRRLRSAVGRRDRLKARLIGCAPAIMEIRRQIKVVADTDADVLITGDTGTGKEVAARALHALSSRRDKPFIAINCGAIPGNLIESELFGHEVGAFPGATRARHGKFEHARGGTVFLDEIESMSQELQVKLLRAVQERAITQLGSNEPIKLDVRFMATSKSDLEKAASEGLFRRDLLYRLNVVTLKMPPLDERKEDIPRLFIQFVNEAAARYRREPLDVPPATLSALANREWPGNVRELRNAAERFMLGLGDADIETDAINLREQLADRVAAFERNAIAAELTANRGSLKATYEKLGISRKALYEKMQKYGLSRKNFVT
jgi:two-component system C4-dicarboxylate transport response regulator DctD